jgi:hypothetical protein
MKRVISTDGISKKTTMEYDANEQEYIIKTEQKIDPIKDLAKAQLDNHRPGDMIGNTQKHYQKIGEIPAVLYHDLLQKFGSPAQNLKAWYRWLQDVDNQAFRTTNGRLI